jgi:hypothetical protein
VGLRGTNGQATEGVFQALKDVWGPLGGFLKGQKMNKWRLTFDNGSKMVYFLYADNIKHAIDLAQVQDWNQDIAFLVSVELV